MMSELSSRIETLRREGLEKVRTEEFDEAIALYDEALALANDDDEIHELVTINKANALIAAERTGPEVKALPMILMRRRNTQHTFLAAYALMYTHRLAGESKRAIFYGQIALEAAIQAEQSYWRLGALNELGIVYETDSQFPKAVECFEQALALLDTVDGIEEHSFSHVALLGNLGYNKILVGETKEGLRLLHSIVDRIRTPSAKSDAYVELCFGYGNLEQFETARHYGELGLELACEPRQIRNAHYLLGEAAYKMGDVEAAEDHFEQLARLYQQFRHLKSLLFAIDLRSMLNLKL
jgi:tetratricopeptide (TPR) repeat protein